MARGLKPEGDGQVAFGEDRVELKLPELERQVLDIAGERKVKSQKKR